MKSVILKTAANYILPLLLLFSVFILLRGHNHAGGGFVGGLVASIAFVLHAFAYGFQNVKKLMIVNPAVLVPIGLFVCLSMGMLPMFLGKPFMTGIWSDIPMPVIGSIGTALFFDIGVYLVVIGATLTILFTISESVQN